MSEGRNIQTPRSEMRLQEREQKRLGIGKEIRLSERIDQELYSRLLKEKHEKYLLVNSLLGRMLYDSLESSQDSWLIYQEIRSKVLHSTMGESSQITK
jgi:hypothetical protein